MPDKFIRNSNEGADIMTTKHTCGGPIFGRKTAGCPRCDELIAGAAPITWDIRPKYDTYIRHTCTAACGPVCTANDW